MTVGNDLMLAAVITRPGTIELKEMVKPVPGAGEVLIKVDFCGICGTDIKILHGVYSSEYLPLIPGHEFAGKVEQLGNNVDNLTVGDSVTVDINQSCGTCYYCQANMRLNCTECRQLGIHKHGAFAEYVVAPASHVIKLPEDVSTLEGALVEPISCVVRAAKFTELRFTQSVVILGDGAIGLMHAQMARLCGAAPVIVVGHHASRMVQAKNMGADFTLFDHKDVVSDIKKINSGRGADLVIESVGKIETYNLAQQLVRPGGKILAFGLTEPNDVLSVQPFSMVLQETSVLGSCAGMGSDLTDALELMKYKRFFLEPFTTTVLPLERVKDGFGPMLKDRSNLKILIRMP